jgi:hypothetical protein
MLHIDVKAAVKAAQDYLLALFPHLAADVRLEEVELIDATMDGPAVWNVTLSFTTPSTDLAIGHNALTQLLDPIGSKAVHYPRYFKVFVIDAGTGEARAMRIRNV